MNAYFTVPLGENISETPEGFLICHDAVLGRTGWQTYKVKDLPEQAAKELGVDISNPDADIDLYRPADEVFSKETLASIEGKPVTDDHPASDDGFVHPDNFKEFSCGHVQNVRRGKEPLESGDYPILGDVHITAEPLLSEVKHRVKRELSLGYDYQIRRNGEKIEMCEMVANHVAVVPNGRAGHEARIKDSAESSKKDVASDTPIVKIENESAVCAMSLEGQEARIEPIPKEPKVKLTWKNIWGAGLKARAADASEEDLADASIEMADKRRAMDVEEFDRREKKGRAKDDRFSHIRDSMTKCMDGQAKDADLSELRGLLDEYLEEEKGEPEHMDDHKAKDKKRKDSDGEIEKEAEQPTKIDVDELHRTLVGDEEGGEEKDDDEENAEFAEDADKDEDDDKAEEEQEDEPEEDEFEKTADKAKASDKGRAHDGALAVLKALRPAIARSKDSNVRAAFQTALKEVAHTSKPRTGSYAKFAARARAHDTVQPKSEAEAAAELDAVFAQARTQGRK